MILKKGNRYRYTGKLSYMRGKIFTCKGVSPWSTGEVVYSMSNGYVYRASDSYFPWEEIKVTKPRIGYWK